MRKSGNFGLVPSSVISGRYTTKEISMMLRVAARLACAALLTIAAFSQTTESGSKSEVGFLAADVHASPKVRNSFLNGPFLRGNRYEIHFATVLALAPE